MPRLALISPKGADYTQDEQLSSFLKSDNRMQNIRRMWSSPNLGLLVIAALTPSNWEIVYIDEHHREIDFTQQYDVVGISCMTQQILRGYEIASEFRLRGITTVIGGIHATVCPDEVISYVDSVMVGEAESLWEGLLKDWENGQLKSIYKEDIPGSCDVTKSPIPRYDLIVDYPYETITIDTSRGCNHNCSFCAASKVYGSVYRRKSNDQILAELNEIIKYFPDRYVLFGDDNLFVSRDECKDLLERIKPLGIRWAAQTDISIAEDVELVRKMADGGCIWVVIGLESITSANLTGVEAWKATRVQDYKASVRIIQENGVGVMGAFVFGMDYDDNEKMEKTIEFINDCNLYGIHVTSPTPFPGTRFRQEIIDADRLIDKPWSYYTHWDIIIQPKMMKEEELKNCIYKIYQSFSSEENMQKRFQTFIHQMRNRKKNIVTVKPVLSNSS